jgi:murein DD-endopeptidase MepM/ murein hydrolase activator NlpD
MKQIFSTLTLVGFILMMLSPSIGSAIDPRTSGRILDDFKSRQETILFESAPIEVSDASKLLQEEYAMHGLESLKGRLAQIESVYQQKKSDLTEVRRSLEDALAVLVASITATEQSINETTESIDTKREKIQQLQSDSILLQKKIHGHRTIILSYLANIYSESSQVTDNDGNIDLIKWLMMTDEDSDVTLSDITYKALVAQVWQKWVDEYRWLVRSYYRIAIQTQQEEEQMKLLQSGLEKQKANLEEQKASREKLIEQTAWEEARYVEYIATQQQAQAQVESLWKDASSRYETASSDLMSRYNCSKAQKSTDDTIECARIRQYFANEKTLGNSEMREGTPNILDWPTTSRRITSYFHDAGYYSALGSHHEAIDIATPQGTDILAPADGYVSYTLLPSPGGYSYMALKHRDQYTTVYGHLSEILVSRDTFVRRWQLIARSGGAVGTAWAWPMTSGPHLHFEVWKGRQPVDPLRSLSLVGIEYAELPSVYQDKFISDIVEVSGTGSVSQYEKKFKLLGSDEAERQQYLLSHYATPDFRDWNMWVDTALEWHLDPSFVMCVGLAETTLGNHLKTPYNIGNIGNTDSGSTYSFASPTEGIEWMAATFNNKYLGKYTKLSELSRWGNPDGTIYASSSSNWHQNTVKCLSALKWEFVDDDYAFRRE